MNRPIFPIETRDAGDIQHASFPLDIKAVSEKGAFEGYGSVFNVEDTYADVIEPGAFAKSLAAHKSAGTLPALLWQHDSYEPVGVWEEMREDDKGLFCKGRLLDTTRGTDAYKCLKAGALNGLSIGFRSKGWSYDEETDIRTLTEVELWEVSVVTFPANRSATVTGVKNATIETERDLERALRDAGHSKKDAQAIVSRVRNSILGRRDASFDGIGETMKSAERLLNLINGV